MSNLKRCRRQYGFLGLSVYGERTGHGLDL